MRPWTKKYEPNNTKEVEGQPTPVSNLKTFIEHIKNNPKKAFMLHGAPGSGKTCSVYAIANELDLEVLEVNASDFRNKDKINEVF